MSKIAILTVLAITTVISTNIASFFLSSFDAWSYFGGFKDVHSITDWNLPHTVHVDFNSDGVADTVSYTGHICPSVSSIEHPKYWDCVEGRLSKASNEGAFNSHGKVLLAYIGKDHGDTWHLISLTTSRLYTYTIAHDGTLEPSSPSIGTQLDALIYRITHLFALL